MKNVDTGKDYLQNILSKIWEIIEKCLVSKIKNLMTICGLFETQFSSSFYKKPKNTNK